MSMQWIKPTRQQAKVRFRAMMESGQLVDEIAEIIQTQVIAHKARASMRNREAVPLYHQTEEGRPPIWQENLLVETGYAQPPGMDSRYVLEDSQNLWKGLKTGAVKIDEDSKLQRNTLAIIANVAAVLVFFSCAWLAGLNLDKSAPAARGDATATSTEAVLEGEFGHGPVDKTADAEVGEGSGPDSEEGGDGSSSAPEGAGEGPGEPAVDAVEPSGSPGAAPEERP